jgi:hypothetical protein
LFPEVSVADGAKILKLRAKGFGISEISTQLAISRQAIENFYQHRRQPTAKQWPKIIADPELIYSLTDDSIYITKLRTGELSRVQVVSTRFCIECIWTELPDGTLLVTGLDRQRTVCIVDTVREYAVTTKAPMIHARSLHTSVYYDQHVYVIGCAKDCERYACAEDRWEVFGELPGELNYAYRCITLVLMEAVHTLRE